MLTIDDDLDYLDGLETVSVVQPGGGAPVVDVIALRRRVAGQEAEASGGAYTQHDVRFHLATRTMTEEPQVGATITDGGAVSWRVLRVDANPLATAWRCWCRRVGLNDELDQTITIQRARWAIGGLGVPAAVWTDELTGVAARIQPQREVIEIQRQARLARVTHKVFVAAAIEIDENHRIVHGADVNDVVGTQQEARIDGLLVILAQHVA
jgi:hypothetical protein